MQDYLFSLDKSFIEENKKINKLAVELDVFNVDFSDVFCNDGICSPIDEKDNILYYDDDHLNVYGAKWLYNKYRLTTKYSELLDYINS